MEKREIKITMEVGDNLRAVLAQILAELHRYPDTKETNKGLEIMAELIQKLLGRGVAEVRQGEGYYDSNWRSKDL